MHGRRQRSSLQPVDEDVNLADVVMLSKETGTQMIYYREIGIWHYGDYAHVVLGRYQNLTSVALRQSRPGGVAALRQCVKRLLDGDQPRSTGRRD